MGDRKKFDYSFTQDRELSWLRFNERVLEEARDKSVPLFERLRFISIFASNLDEFFMIRVGSLYDLSQIKQAHTDNKTGMMPGEQLKAIYAAMPALYEQKDKMFLKVDEQLRFYDINDLSFKNLMPEEHRYIFNYYHQNIRPLLSPQIVDLRHPFPHLENRRLNIAVWLKNDEKSSLFGIIPIPPALPGLVFLPGEGIRFLRMEKILLEFAEEIFSMYKVSDKAVIAVTRNADINFDDESFEVDNDYRQDMRKALKERARMACVRLEVYRGIGAAMRDYLIDRLHIKKEQVYKSKSPISMLYVSELENKLPSGLRRELTYPPFEPVLPRPLQKWNPMLMQVLRRDILLFYPYESMDPFLRMVKEAANDPAVVSIKITIYRLANKSRLVEYLSAAAENGKEVIVLMELRARFDESNNINWSETLEDAGCKVIYGIEDYKVHSKICLITRKEKGRIQLVTQIGTGNYNEKTAKLYTDFCLMTADRTIGEDAVNFFKNIAISNLNGTYHDLLVAPGSMKNQLMDLLDGQIRRSREGKDACVIIKVNSVTDRELIDKLSEASCAGVRIDLIVRGICCILPQIPGKTENVRIISVVGRYLEHSRIYCFLQDNGYQVYISSADIMTRNMDNRVEIACPVKDERLKRRILEILRVMLSDTVKARRICSDGRYAAIPRAEGEKGISCQEYFRKEAEEGNFVAEELPSRFLLKFRSVTGKFRWKK